MIEWNPPVVARDPGVPVHLPINNTFIAHRAPDRSLHAVWIERRSVVYGVAAAGAAALTPSQTWARDRGIAGATLAALPGRDALAIAWLEGATIYLSLFDPLARSWSEPWVITSNAKGPPSLAYAWSAAHDPVIALAWVELDVGLAAACFPASQTAAPTISVVAGGAALTNPSLDAQLGTLRILSDDRGARMPTSIYLSELSQGVWSTRLLATGNDGSIAARRRDGLIIAAWQRWYSDKPTEIILQRSTDGGKSFAAPPALVGRPDLPDGVVGHGYFPRVALASDTDDAAVIWERTEGSADDPSQKTPGAVRSADNFGGAALDELRGGPKNASWTAGCVENGYLDLLWLDHASDDRLVRQAGRLLP